MLHLIRHPLGGSSATRRRKLIGAAAAASSLLFTAAAIAFVVFVLIGTAASSSSSLPSQGGQQDVSSAMAVSWNAANLKVGGSAPYTVTVDSSQLNQAGTVDGVTLSVTNGSGTPLGPECPGADFVPTNTNSYPMTIQPNTGPVTIASGVVNLNSDPNTNQSGCQGDSVRLNATATP